MTFSKHVAYARRPGHMIVMFVRLLNPVLVVVSRPFGLALPVKYVRSNVCYGIKIAEDNRFRGCK